MPGIRKRRGPQASEESTPARRRGPRVSARVEEEAPREETSSRRTRSSRTESAASGAPKKKSGWGAVRARKESSEAAKAASATKLRDFYLRDGDASIIQVLSEEPICVEGHSITNKHGKYDFQVCQHENQRYCLMCDEGISKTWKAGFKVLDHRGDWDKDKKEYKWNKPIEKLWLCGQKLAVQLESFSEKKRKPLNELVIEITRSGSGARDTTYNMELAYDEDDRPEKPILDFKEERDTLEEAMTPLSDDALIALGFSKTEE